MSNTESKSLPQAPPPPNRSFGSLLGNLPGLAALGIASLYSLGAILWAAELQGADLDVPSALPLIPLEQILGRGIGVAVLVAIVASILLWQLPAMVWVERRLERREKRMASYESQVDQVLRDADAAIDQRDREAVTARLDEADRQLAEWKAALVGRKTILAIAVVSFVLLCVIVAVSPPVVAGTYVVALTALGLYARYGKTPRLRYGMAILTATLSAGVLAQAYIDPRPLPKVELQLVGGADPIQGRLVVATGDTWFLTTGKNRIVAIPNQRVERSQIRFIEYRRNTILGIVTGRSIRIG